MIWLDIYYIDISYGHGQRKTCDHGNCAELYSCAVPPYRTTGWYHPGTGGTTNYNNQQHTLLTFNF
jgi:hypothetical protein